MVVDKGKGSLDVRCRRSGYAQSQVGVGQSFNAWTIVNVLFWPGALVDAANFTSAGSIIGWLKILVTDDQSTGPITDGDYYIPFYSVPTA